LVKTRGKTSPDSIKKDLTLFVCYLYVVDMQCVESRKQSDFALLFHYRTKKRNGRANICNDVAKICNDVAKVGNGVAKIQTY